MIHEDTTIQKTPQTLSRVMTCDAADTEFITAILNNPHEKFPGFIVKTASIEPDIENPKKVRITVEYANLG